MPLSLEDKHLFSDSVDENLDEIKQMELPPFVTHLPDIEFLQQKADDFAGYENLIIIGNGGSVNNSYAYYDCLDSKKNVCFVKTMEPGFLQKVGELYPKENSLVIAISKSGTTVGVLESLMFFINKDYNVVGITEEKGTLYEICKKKNYTVIPHPEVGGRFSANTSCALFPSALMGLDINKLNKGFLSAYENFNPEKDINNNPALRLASKLYALEQNGTVDAFLPVYSTRLSALLPIIVQLMHESFGKESKGLSFFGDLAPESQHHTNQRFFGGRQNICALFMNPVPQSHEKISVPEQLKQIQIKDTTLEVLHTIPYEKALEFEFRGTYEDAVNKRIPACSLSIENIDEESVGELLGFWQYMAVYSSLLRGVNPYDQPQVESSKKLSFQKRHSYKE